MKLFFRNFILLSIILLAACEKDQSPFKVDMGYDYFPTDVGHWIIYQVDEIIKDDFTGKTDSFSYQIMEVIDSTFIDNEGRETKRLERFIRASATDPWIIHRVWIANRTSSTAEKVEENIRYVKLTFPVGLNNSWDGNNRNTMDEQYYEYIYTDVPETKGGLSFASTLTVKQKDDDFINKRELDVEQYARGVGMIYKQILDLDICFRCSPSFKDTIDAAYIYTESIIDYGSN